MSCELECYHLFRVTVATCHHADRQPWMDRDTKELQVRLLNLNEMCKILCRYEI